MRLALLLAAAVILIGDDSLKPWFDSLRNKLGLYCCAEADGHPLDDLSGTSRTIASAFSCRANGLLCLTMRYF